VNQQDKEKSRKTTEGLVQQGFGKMGAEVLN